MVTKTKRPHSNFDSSTFHSLELPADNRRSTSSDTGLNVIQSKETSVERDRLTRAKSTTALFTRGFWKSGQHRDISPSAVTSSVSQLGQGPENEPNATSAESKAPLQKPVSELRYQQGSMMRDPVVEFLSPEGSQMPVELDTPNEYHSSARFDAAARSRARAQMATAYTPSFELNAPIECRLSAGSNPSTRFDPTAPSISSAHSNYYAGLDGTAFNPNTRFGAAAMSNAPIAPVELPGSLGTHLAPAVSRSGAQWINTPTTDLSELQRREEDDLRQALELSEMDARNAATNHDTRHRLTRQGGQYFGQESTQDEDEEELRRVIELSKVVL
jgi:hypothetical protein